MNQKAEQAGSPWAKTISDAFGKELVRRWNAYEPMQYQIDVFQREIERLVKELKNARKGDE